uniref:2-oxoglutarate and iron-dependent oxygenase domain-containing protein 2-like n=1 Tax=Castor canadensis TaxID=51338 RepID=A0A8B7U6W9_CASCN|nr:2-oxoglutarate and iron-dependent oxygenase domain-containing protein 2-like [Castor canadensis]
MATAGAPRRFCRCACFCSENLYVARYGLHLRFRSEQQLRQDYVPILRSRGCISPQDFQQLLAEVTLPALPLDLCQQAARSPSLRPGLP